MKSTHYSENKKQSFVNWSDNANKFDFMKSLVMVYQERIKKRRRIALGCSLIGMALVIEWILEMASIYFLGAVIMSFSAMTYISSIKGLVKWMHYGKHEWLRSRPNRIACIRMFWRQVFDS